jgi:hypothetical protein
VAIAPPASASPSPSRERHDERGRMTSRAAGPDRGAPHTP